MTEFEAATLAYQNASLAIQEAGLAIQQGRLTLGYWQTALSAVTLAVSSGLVLYGFRLMGLGTEQRREEAKQQHTETMRALEQQGEALRVLIERTRN